MAERVRVPRTPHRVTLAPACGIISGVGCYDGTTLAGGGQPSIAGTSAELSGPACGDTQNDARHCGSCDVSCAPGASCVAGICVDDTDAVALRSGPPEIAGAGPAGPAPLAVIDVGRWTPRGPRIGGRLSGVVVTPDGDRMLVSSPGGGVWRRESSAPAEPDMPAIPWTTPGARNDGDHSTMQLAWDENGSGRLWRANRNSLQWSTDLGASWTTVVNSGARPNGLLPDRTGFNVRDVGPFAQLPLGELGTAYLYGWGCDGLWYSFDGITFQQSLIIPDDPSDENNCIGNIAADGMTGFVYVSTLRDSRASGGFAEQFVFRSRARWEFGLSPPPLWEQVPWRFGNGLEAVKPIGALTAATISPFDHRIVAVTGAPTQTFVFSSQQERWITQPRYTGADQFARSLLFVREGVESGSTSELLLGNKRMLHSLDLGSSWAPYFVEETPGDRDEHVDVNAIYYSADPALPYLWNVNDGADATGSSFNIMRWAWQPGRAPGCMGVAECPPGMPDTPGESVPITNLSAWQAFGVTVAPPVRPSSPRKVFVGTVDNGARCFSDASTSGASDYQGSGGSGGDVFSFVFSPANDQVAYTLSNVALSRAGNAQSGRCSSPGLVDWRGFSYEAMGIGGANPGGGRWSKSLLAPHPTNQNVVFFAANSPGNDAGAVFRARYQPATSRMTATALPAPQPGREVLALMAERRGFGRRLYAAPRATGVFVSRDDGDSWMPWGSFADAPEIVLAIERGGTATQPLYYLATSDGLYAGDPERELNWRRAFSPAGYVVSDVEVDPSEPCRVYIALAARVKVVVR